MKQQFLWLRNQQTLFCCALSSAVAVSNLLSAFCLWVKGYFLFFSRNADGHYVADESVNLYRRVLGLTFSEWGLASNRARLFHAGMLGLCLILLGLVALLRVWPLLAYAKAVLGLYLIPLCVAYVFMVIFDPMNVTQAMEALLYIPYRGARWMVALVFGIFIFLRQWYRHVHTTKEKGAAL